MLFRSTHELISKPELLRLHGEFLQRETPEQADDYYKRSWRCARAQRSNSMELRTLTDLHQLRVNQGARHTYRDALQRIFDRFDDGIDTPDLARARATLEA